MRDGKTLMPKQPRFKKKEKQILNICLLYGVYPSAFICKPTTAL
jgi:hypothetical protein